MVGGDDAPVGLDAAGLYDGHVDTEGLEFYAQGVADSFDAVLAHIVPAAEGEDGATGYGGDVDDAATVLAAHDGEHEARHLGEAEDVDLQLVAGILEGHALDGAEVAVAGIVDEHVNAAFALQDGVHTLAARGVVGDIESQGRDAVGLEGLHEGCAARGGIDLVPHAGEALGSLETNAAAAARNQYYFLLVHNT